MKNVLKSVTVLAAFTSLAFAGEETTQSKDLKKVIEDQGIYVETAKPGVTLSGYVDAGYSYGFQGSSSTATARVPNDAKGGGNFGLNAFKLALEKTLSTKNEFSAGFRADLIYGDDVASLGGSSVGTATGGSAAFSSSNDFLLEQAYVDFNAPVGNGIVFKVGKFVTPLGYEVIERPSNANITYGNLFQNMIPLYHTGILASYKVNDIVDVKAGVVNGWNSDHGTTFGSSTEGVGLLGTINVTAPGGNANIQNGAFVGLNNNATGVDPGFGTTVGDTLTSHALWVYDIWGQWKPKFAGDKLTLGFNGDIGSYDYSVGGISIDTTTWAGAALYAKYQFTKIFALASRADWMHSDDGLKVGTPAGTDIYSVTLTAELDAWENMLLRAEYRADFGNFSNTFAPGAGTPAAAGPFFTSGPDQMVDLEAVYSF